MEEACHEHLMRKYFEKKSLTSKDAHHASESTWKNGENSMKNKPFYSSVEWNMLASKIHDPNEDYEHGCHNATCIEKPCVPT